MARKKQVANNMSVRLSEGAVRLARIASGYTGEPMADYISRIVSEKAQLDISKLHDQFKVEPIDSKTSTPTDSKTSTPTKSKRQGIPSDR